MLTTARTASHRVATLNIAPRAAAAVGSTRFMSIGDVLEKKVRGNVDEYIVGLNPIFDIRQTNQLVIAIRYFFSPILQEKVEEDRYIRAREAQIAAAKAAAVAAETKAVELASKSQQLIEAKTAWMNEVADLLAQSGDVVSEAALANLADWKHA